MATSRFSSTSILADKFLEALGTKASAPKEESILDRSGRDEAIFKCECGIVFAEAH